MQGWIIYIQCRQVFHALLRQEVAFFDVQTTGALVSRLTNDTQTLQNAAFWLKNPRFSRVFIDFRSVAGPKPTVFLQFCRRFGS